MATATERFEALGDLYYRRHHRLRPGKSEAPETYRDSGSDENRELFESWLATDAFKDALDRIVEAEEILTELTRAVIEADDLGVGTMMDPKFAAAFQKAGRLAEKALPR